MPKQNPYKKSRIGSDNEGGHTFSNERYSPSNSSYSYGSANRLSILRKLGYTFLSIFCLVLGFIIGLLIIREFSSSGFKGFLLTCGGAIVILAFLIFSISKIWRSDERNLKLIALIIINAILPLIWVILHKFIQ